MLKQEAKSEPQSFFAKAANFIGLGSSASQKDKVKLARSNSSDEEMEEEVYMQRNISAHECDSDDLEGEMNMSDEEPVQSRIQVKQ